MLQHQATLSFPWKRYTKLANLVYRIFPKSTRAYFLYPFLEGIMKKEKVIPIDSLDLVDLYIRVSTTEQALEGYSVAEQEHRLRQYCAAMGHRIHKVHIDAGFSGASLDRPGIKETIKDVQQHLVRRVIVWKLDRLSRSQKDTLIMLEDVFLENGCDFISMMESFDTSTSFGRAIVGILAAFAQLERENIKERTMMGRQARLAKGHYNSSRPPLGYSFIPGSNDLQVDPYQAAIVREIFRLFLSGTSINAIARKMEEKYPTVRTWNNTMIRRTLKNPVYIGKVKDQEAKLQITKPLDWSSLLRGLRCQNASQTNRKRLSFTSLCLLLCQPN